MTENLVDISEISKVFSEDFPPALQGITATIPPGEIFGVVGPDGAGKTTLIRLIAALMLPTKGSITVAGADTVHDPEKIHLFSSYMPQRFGLYEDLTVMQNLELYADLRGVVGEERKEKFERLLHFTNLEPFTKRLAGNLSGGMKQKLGLACSLIKKPKLLLLDEPTVGVDPLSRRELWKIVQEQLEEGISVIWSTAYLDEAERCGSVLLINEGTLLFNGKPSVLTERVKGRVFKLSSIVDDKRKILEDLIQREDVIDGVIQGKDLRIVLKDKKPESLAGNWKVEEITPRFEDAFIDILGGVKKGRSKLAERFPQVQSPLEEMVIAKDLTKKFGAFVAADHENFSVKKGEIFGLLGPNGAGKSTTFKMLCGLMRPTEGSAIVGGLDLQKALGAARAQLGYMAQKFSLHGTLNVFQNLRFFSGIYNLFGKAQYEAIDAMVEIFNLKQYLHTSAALLPLGYKQRLSLACATMHNPPILFLDEPTSGVDPLTRREFWNHINGLVRKGVTVMVTTHFMDEAEYCDRIAFIYKGKIIRMDTPEGLKEVVKSEANQNPTLEEAFIKLIEEYDLETADRK